MARLLVTGFERFPGVPVNISETLVSGWRQQPPHWPFSAMRFEVLPTAYAAAGEGIARLLADFAPDCCLMFGVAGASATLRLERFALNIDDAAIPDAAGDLRQGSAIEPDGPSALTTAVDLPRLHRVLKEAGVNAEISNHAGSYVCNHTFYAALSAAARQQRRIDVVFAHIPSGARDGVAASGEEEDAILQAVAAGADHLAAALAAGLAVSAPRP